MEIKNVRLEEHYEILNKARSAIEELPKILNDSMIFPGWHYGYDDTENLIKIQEAAKAILAENLSMDECIKVPCESVLALLRYCLDLMEL